MAIQRFIFRRFILIMEDYVSFEQAQRLKELGFDWGCDFVYYFTYHNHNKPIFQRYETTRDYEMEKYWDVPTLAQAQKWLREVKGVDITIEHVYHRLDTGDKIMYGLRIGIQSTFDTKFIRNYDSYKEALSAGVDRAIELVKSK